MQSLLLNSLLAIVSDVDVFVRIFTRLKSGLPPHFFSTSTHI